jgi:hypothetical protein
MPSLHAAEIPITIQDVLGHTWPTSLVHRSVDFGNTGFTRDKVALFEGKTQVPVQLDAVVTDANGKLKSADVWFRTGLASNETRVFVLREGTLSMPPAGLAPVIATNGSVVTMDNGLTAVKFPGASWSAPANVAAADIPAAFGKHLGLASQANAIPAPLLGVRLASGRWTAASRLGPARAVKYESLQGLIQPETIKPVGALEGYTTEILASGPLFAKARVTYRFVGEGRYVAEFELRTGEPMVRISERYDGVGSVVFDFGREFQPTGAVHVAMSSAPNGRCVPLNPDRERTVAMFTGWNFFFNDVAAAYALIGDPAGDLLGLVSTEPDWLPLPYNQALYLIAGPGMPLRAEGALNAGHRQWGLVVGKTADFPSPAPDFYRWWNSQVVLSLDKVSNWPLTWLGMDTIEFPHTFFAKSELPGIRARLQAEPVIKEFIENVPVRITTEAAAAYLVTGEPRYVDMIATNQAMNPIAYLDGMVDMFLNQNGYFTKTWYNPMQMTDELFQRLMALDFLLGSDRVTPEQRRQALIKLAFASCLMHDPTWIPPNHDYAPNKDEPYIAYVQGTPNQKQCYLSVRAMTACMLTGHPRLPAWLNTAIEENERVTSGSVAPSGAHLESPFYSARDTMRYGPFWKAMMHAGITDERATRWVEREKRCYQYMADMLTPPEPRMGGRRVYQPIGRSSSGVIDPTFMIGADPFGLKDPAHCQLMRWSWEAQGKPSPYNMGTTGGRDLAQTILAFSQTLSQPAGEKTPLASRRWEGMGAIFRSQAGTNYESNVLFRHDPFCWNLYPGNNGAVYFYGKGAPLSIRFGAYWTAPHLMSVPFGNRLIFGAGAKEDDWTDALGTMTDCALLGDLADYASGITRSNDWRRTVLFAKDLSKEDPVYLLVRDDVYRSDLPAALHWWVMSKAVQPDGLEKPGVIPPKGTDEAWLAKMGKNWSNAPALKGQFQHFEGQCGVDLDLFIAAPSDPVIVSDAVGVGPKLAYCVNPELYEYQQLVRIEQAPGKGFMTLLTPRWPGSVQPAYRTLGNGIGVAVKHSGGEDRLFLTDKPAEFKDELVTWKGQAGFARKGADGTLRLMVTGGSIASGGITLTSSKPAALRYDGKVVTLVAGPDVTDAKVELAGAMKGVKIQRVVR